MRPNRFVLKVGAVQPITVIAHFSDGSERDVSHWAKYTANDTSVCTVDDEGKVTAGQAHGAKDRSPPGI